MHSDESYREGTKLTENYLDELARLANEDLPALIERGDLDAALLDRMRKLLESGQLDATLRRRLGGGRKNASGHGPPQTVTGKPPPWLGDVGRAFRRLRRQPVGLAIVASLAAALAVWGALAVFGPAPSQPQAALDGSASNPNPTVPPPSAPVANDPPSRSLSEVVEFVDEKFRTDRSWFGSLTERVRAASPAAPLAPALSSWVAGEPVDDGAYSTIRTGMVQVLMRERGAGITVIDGEYQISCGGGSCLVVRNLWRSEAESGADVPPFPDDVEGPPSSAHRGLADFEKVLIYRSIEAGP